MIYKHIYEVDVNSKTINLTQYILNLNGKEIRGFPTKDFQSLSIAKHSQIEVMDWKYYVKPIEKN